MRSVPDGRCQASSVENVAPIPPPRARTDRREALVAFALAVLVALVFAGFAELRHPFARRIGDEGTFVAMAESLAHDGDLGFGAADRARALASAGGPPTLILQQTAEGIAYSKPVLYAFWSAPFVALFGAAGLVLANFAALALAFVLAWGYLRRLAPSGRALLVLVTFGGAGALAAQIAWQMTESLQVGLALAGLTLSFGAVRPRIEAEPGRVASWLERSGAAWVGAFLLGLFASLRDPNLLIAALPALGAAIAGRLRRALALAAVGAIAYAGVIALTVGFTGGANPYRAIRSSFDAESGYPVEGQPPHPFFTEHAATQTLALRPEFEPRRTFAAAVTFLLGRHTGLFVYYPATLVLLAAALRRPDRTGWLLLAAAGALGGFYVIWMPNNYFGGESFLSNRYYLAALPLFLVAPRKLPGRLAMAMTWLLAGVLAASAYASIQATAAHDKTTQSHTHAGFFRLLPYETTGAPIDGRRDRYWSGDFVRFTDPFAEVDPWTFTLRSGEPSAELVIASYWWEHRPSFVAVVEGGPAELVATDWRGSHREALPAPGGGVVRVVVTPRVGKPWRWHSYWWGPPGEIYGVRTMRLAVRATTARATKVTFRYLGRELRLRPAAQLVAGSLPAAAGAGGTSILRLRLRNTGETTWSSQAALPTFLGYRISGPGNREIAEGRSELSGPMAPGSEGDVEIPIAWPSLRGEVRVRVDLLREDLAWFGDGGAGPLLDGSVRLAP